MGFGSASQSSLAAKRPTKTPVSSGRRRATPESGELRLGKPAFAQLAQRRPTCSHRLRLAEPSMHGFHYVYLLGSLQHEETYYVGLTDDLSARLLKHNRGEVPHTSKFRPWQIKTAIAFRDRARAAALETYLKPASGRAFAKKRF
jgi:putative endonuclease